MLILAYLQIDLCLFCATPAVNKDIRRIISIFKRKALLPLPLAHFFLLHFRPNVCSTGKVSNGKLRDELNLKYLVPWVSIATLNICMGHSELLLSLSLFWTCSPKHGALQNATKDTMTVTFSSGNVWLLQENQLASFGSYPYLRWVTVRSLIIKNLQVQPHRTGRITVFG